MTFLSQSGIKHYPKLFCPILLLFLNVKTMFPEGQNWKIIIAFLPFILCHLPIYIVQNIKSDFHLAFRNHLAVYAPISDTLENCLPGVYNTDIIRSTIIEENLQE